MQSNAAAYAHEAIERLVYWMRDTTNPSTSLSATNTLLDRAFGRPKDAEQVDPSAAKTQLPDLNVQIVFVNPDGQISEAVQNRLVSESITITQHQQGDQ